jgi:uncharacterized protein YdcH (DUF465 family)
MEKLKTRMTINVVIMGTVKTLDVYKVPLNELYYNDKNDRISTFISEFKGELGNLSKTDKQNRIEKFIIKSNENAYKTTKKSIKEDTQLKPGIVANDGRVLDGNRRFTCLRELSRDEMDTKYDYFLCAVLDGEYANLSEKEIKKIEYNLQFAEEKPVDYDTIDMLVGMYNNVIMIGINDDQDPVLTPKEYIDSKKIKMKDFEKDRDTISVMIDYLDYINRPLEFHVARDGKLKEALLTISEGLKKTKASEEVNEQLKDMCFDILVTDAKPYVSLTHTLRALLKNYKDNKSAYTKAFDEYDEIADDIFDEVIGDEGFTKSKQVQFNKSKVGKQLNNILLDLVESNNIQGIKDKPITLIKAAIKKVEGVDYGVVKTFGSEKNNEFLKYVQQLEDEIVKIKGEFDVKL